MKLDHTHCPFCGSRIDGGLAAALSVPPSELAQADLELQLESSLLDAFTLDEFRLSDDPESSGDILQQVRNGRDEICGSVLWRPCADRVWSIDALRQLEAQARGIQRAQCVLVSPAVPETAKPFLLFGNVWVAEPEAAVALGVCLRLALIHQSLAGIPPSGLADTTAAVCSYLESGSFRNSVGTVIANYLASRSSGPRPLSGTVHLN